MGIFNKQGKDGKVRWFIDFYHQSQRIRECVGTSKTMAEKALATRKGEVLQGRYNVKPKRGPLFRDFAPQWLEERKAYLKPSSLYDYNCIFRRYLLPTFGTRPLGKIVERDLENFVSFLQREGLGNKRINNVLIPLKTLFKTAYRRKIISSNPIEFIGVLRVDKPEIRPLDMNEVRLFLEGVDPHFKNYFTVALFTGLRPSEQICLKWDGIDFIRDKITVTDARVMGIEGPPKTVESRRVIDMIPPVKEALKSQAEGTFLKGPYVFVTKEGSIVDVHNLRERVWYPALKKAGLRRRTMYQTRHTFATLMLSSGENPSWVARMMGHTTTEMLFKRYSKYIPNVTHRDGFAFMTNLYSGHGHFLDT